MLAHGTTALSVSPPAGGASIDLKGRRAIPNPITRNAAFAGHWYPGSARELGAAVDACLAGAPPPRGPVGALVAPHAGLMYSGPVAGPGYAAVAGGSYDLVVLIGPSHYAAFPGVAVAAPSAFDSPLGPVPVDQGIAATLLERSTWFTLEPSIHAREHSLELQLPFLARVLPGVPILPLLMGRQDRASVDRLTTHLSELLHGRRPLVVASSDLSHYHDRNTASRLDGVVLDRLSANDAEGLMTVLERQPGHACGGGPIVVAMRVAASLGAEAGRVLRYGDSGDVTGDTSEVVGYVSAAFGRFDDVPSA